VTDLFTGTALLRRVGGLAEAADSIPTKAALAEAWSLLAVLPPAHEVFERDFVADPALDRFHALLARTTAVAKLDGERGRGGGPLRQWPPVPRRKGDCAIISVISVTYHGVPGGIRTHGPRIRNPVLYPAELRGLIVFSTR
jgi:hypothetical protein